MSEASHFDFSLASVSSRNNFKSRGLYLLRKALLLTNICMRASLAFNDHSPHLLHKKVWTITSKLFKVLPIDNLFLGLCIMEFHASSLLLPNNFTRFIVVFLVEFLLIYWFRSCLSLSIWHETLWRFMYNLRNRCWVCPSILL